MGKRGLLTCLISMLLPFFIQAQGIKLGTAKEINELPANTNSATYERLLKAFASSGGDIKDIEYGIINATNNGNYEIIPVIESALLPSQKNVKSLVDYYINIICFKFDF